MLYPDRSGAIDALLDQTASAAAPLPKSLMSTTPFTAWWKIADAAAIQQLMLDKKLVIADGHHRYETARHSVKKIQVSPAPDRVMMSFVNMYSPGVRSLPPIVWGNPRSPLRGG